MDEKFLSPKVEFAVPCNAMKTAFHWKRNAATLVATMLLTSSSAFGWGSKGHKMINRLAVETLPASVPAFLRSSGAIVEITYLGPEPDRWRAELDLNSTQAADHFIDLERAGAASSGELPERRFDFIRDLCEAQVAHPQQAAKFTPEKVGLLPWQANEWFERLEVDMRDYRMKRASGRKTWAVQEAILYDAGVLGHYVGDGSQPLHTTIDYDGWVEARNPEDFRRASGIHREFETDFVDANIHIADVRPLVPAAPRVLHAPFRDFVAYLRESHAQVSEVYRLEKEGDFDGTGTAQARDFTAERLAAGATMLRNLIDTAWVRSARRN